MKVKIITQRHNPLLKRREVVFEAEHGTREGTLTRAELRKNLAEILKTNVDLIFIQRAVTKTGTQITVGEANVYDTAAQAKLVETKHIFERNIPPAKRKEGEASAAKPAEATPQKEEKNKPKEEEKKAEQKPKET